MITLHIEADSSAQLVREVLALAASMGASAGNVTQPAEEPKVDPKPRAKKSDTPAEKDAPTKEEAAPKSSATEASPEAAEVDVTDKASVKNFMSIGIDNLGVQTVSEVMAELGATKFGDISADKYPALVTRLDDLMKAKAKA